MNATVFLVRHASHDDIGKILSGRSKIEINSAGRGQASRLAQGLAKAPLGAVYSSPRRRAVETANIVAEQHHLTVIEADALDEIDFGAWTGRSFAELDTDPAWCRWNEARSTAATPAGENMATVIGRAVRHVEASAGDAPILCVSHCDVIRGIVAHYLGLNPGRMLGFDVDPATLTTLALHDGGAQLIALNERLA